MAEELRNRKKKKPTVKDLEEILNSPEGTYKTYVKKDGSLGSRKVRKPKKVKCCDNGYFGQKHDCQKQLGV